MNIPAGQRVPLDDRGLPVGYPYREDWETTPRMVKAMLDRGEEFVLLDCRQSQEHALVHIKGTAKLLPVQEAAGRLDELSELADKPVVVYCHHGQRSLRMTMLLRQAGFTDVKSMAGGIELWAIDVEPGMTRY